MIKKHGKKVISTLLAFFMLMTPNSMLSVSAENIDAMSESVLHSTAGVYIQSRAEIMLSDNDSSIISDIDADILSISSDEKLQIEKYRDALAQMGETYSDSSSSVEMLSQYMDNDGKLHVKAKETTMLTIAENGMESGYTARHEFIYTNINSCWILTEDRQLEPTGLLPLCEATKFVYGNESSLNGIEATEEISIYPGEIEASVAKPSIESSDKDYTTKSYSYTAMATYLETYWDDYNDDYRDFTDSGGDCTNFASQALRAGGWEDVNGFYQNYNYWWYNFLNQTWSWTSVNYLGSFARASGRCSMLTNVWNLRIGDFLQVQPENSTSKVHTMMVSYFSNGTPYFTYHTSNRYRRSMNQVLLDWGDASYYAYRT